MNLTNNFIKTQKYPQSNIFCHEESGWSYNMLAFSSLTLMHSYVKFWTKILCLNIFHYLPLCQGKTCHSHKTNLIIHTNIKIKQIGWKTYVAILEMSKSLMYVTPWPAQIFPTSTPWYSNNMELLLVNFFLLLARM